MEVMSTKLLNIRRGHTRANKKEVILAGDIIYFIPAIRDQTPYSKFKMKGLFITYSVKDIYGCSEIYINVQQNKGLRRIVYVKKEARKGTRKPMHIPICCISTNGNYLPSSNSARSLYYFLEHDQLCEVNMQQIKHQR